MNRRLWKFSAAPALVCAFVLFSQADASAQGRGASGNPGLNQAMGRTVNVAAGRGNGNPNVGMSGGGPAWPTTGRPPYEYSEQARIRLNNEREADKELRDHPEMPARLNTTAEELREGYRDAHRHNVFLTFRQYVTATRLAANLGRTHPNITRAGLLNGLAANKSFERTLRDRGLGKEEAKEAVRRVEREIKESRRKN
jgi:hypothetical protein